MVLAALAAAVFGGAALRAAGVELPAIPLVPTPLRDPGVVLPLVVLLGLMAAHRHGAASGRPGRNRLRPAHLMPLAAAVVGVDLTLEAIRPLVLHWTSTAAVAPELSLPLSRLGMAGALMGALMGLALAVPRIRRAAQEQATGSRLRSAFCFSVAVLLVVHGVLAWVGVAVVGIGRLRYVTPVLHTAALTLLVGQVVVAVAEEAFYRGFLQTELGRVLRLGGMANRREPRILAVGLVSVLFSIHHLGPDMEPRQAVTVFTYTLCVSLLLGYLFDITRNLAVCALAHLFHNLTVLRLGPQLWAPGGVDAFGDAVYVGAYLLVAFSLLFLLGRSRSPSLAPIRPGP